MDLAALRTFVEVVRQGSFVGVARARNVDPSSVSRIISGVEDELGVRLFQRTTRKLSTTGAGQAYFERVATLVDELDRAADVARDASAKLVGTLRVTASVSFGNACIVPLLPAFHAQHPDVAIDLITTDANLDLVVERIDLAIRMGPRRNVGWISHRLVQTRYRVVAAPSYLAGHPRASSPADLAHHRCLALDLDGFRDRWRFRRRGRETAVDIASTMRFTNALAVHACALAGMGPALLADWLVGSALRDGTLVDMFPQHEVAATDFETAAWVLYPSRSYLPAAVRAFAAHLQAAFSP